jgi:hypothetical protein
MNTFKRLASLGGNMMVLVISLAVFVVAFFVMLSVGESQKAPTIQVLIAAHDLNVGDVIKAEDIATKTVYQDDLASLYINSDEQGVSSLIDGIVTIPMVAGQPIVKTAIVAQAADGTRLSAALVHYPTGNSLFPLPMDQSNIVAPNIESFMSGDMVSITVVISSRPQEQLTATPEPAFLPGGSFVESTPTAAATPQETAKTSAENRTFPPLAKDLFPAGVRVISIQGLPEKVVTTDTTSSGSDIAGSGSNNNNVFADTNKPHVLVLLIPDSAREELALALKEGDMIIVSLIKDGQTGPSAGFTYWDFEDLFKSDRNQVLDQSTKTK